MRRCALGIPAQANAGRCWLHIARWRYAALNATAARRSGRSRCDVVATPALYGHELSTDLYEFDVKPTCVLGSF